MAIMGRKYRTQILFEPEQHQALAEMAREEGRSVSEVVREIIQQYLDEQAEETSWRVRLEALERVREHRAEILKRRGNKPISVDVVELIDEIREERASELFTDTYGGRD